ncbi:MULTISPECIES: chitinase [Streptomyces]|uniref:chitinase n=1 Tax=Streptomyces tsukubensis (strain DSM 42081 / NBRC 108919 / NRRL 18488 / 9993) TaxID=1114943 RepID=I2N594_STRT9|nr:glycosyl hydrolase family 18 protein [Streptomyces tsukubensis]MYS67444.1 chitinase [Streptomyces sp. SID5473]AZK96216.1 chitinase [Streptomyces tsukubensis]EIF92191.1 chitinase I [Streptomyces tsukubensis NRRL18488]QKM67773.1 chitinase [Streptomyces tsukubensis NRRL18488]TAI44169.1 chitinase [Streptomyces tsukubensis]
MVSTRRPRKWLGATLALAVGAGLTVLGAAGPAQAADINNAKNPGFETGLANWSCTGGNGAATSTPVRTGAGALKGTPAGQDIARCSQSVAVKPNSTYTLSAYVQGSFVYLGATGTGTTDVSTWSPGGTGWNQLSTTFRTGASTTSVTVYTHGWYGQSAYYVDDVSVFGPDGGGGGEEPPVIPPVPAGLAAGSPTTTTVPLSWNASPGATQYHVYRNGTKVQTVTTNSTTISGLTPNTQYAFSVSAANTAGESAVSSPPVNVRTLLEDVIPPVPRHAVTGYWQNFNNGATVQKLRDVSPQYDIIAVAFADSTTTPGELTFNLSSALGYANVAEFKSDIAAKKAAGKSVIISVGGELGNVTINSDASATAFANSAYALFQEYGFNGIDIDLEHGINSTYLTKALRQLSAKAGPRMVLTMAPQTIDMQSTGTEYFKLALAVKDILTVVNTQYYNSGAMLGCDGRVYSQGSLDFLTALACIQIQGGLDPSQVGIGVPASPRGAGGGYVSPSTVTAALDCLTKLTSCGTFRPAQAWPGLRGAMTWSINWDATAGNAWSSVVGPHVDALP